MKREPIAFPVHDPVGFWGVEMEARGATVWLACANEVEAFKLADAINKWALSVASC